MMGKLQLFVINSRAGEVKNLNPRSFDGNILIRTNGEIYCAAIPAEGTPCRIVNAITPADVFDNSRPVTFHTNYAQVDGSHVVTTITAVS